MYGIDLDPQTTSDYWAHYLRVMKGRRRHDEQVSVEDTATGRTNNTNSSCPATTAAAPGSTRPSFLRRAPGL